jgi:hypothetical protein
MDAVSTTIRTCEKIADDYCRETQQDVELLRRKEEYIRQLIRYIRKTNTLISEMGCANGRHCWPLGSRADRPKVDR